MYKRQIWYLSLTAWLISRSIMLACCLVSVDETEKGFRNFRVCLMVLGPVHIHFLVTAFVQYQGTNKCFIDGMYWTTGSENILKHFLATRILALKTSNYFNL